MYLSRFGVKNYKCLGNIDIPLTPIHVLIGQNDCGKTSLLEAMAAFFATAETPLREVFPLPWTGRELVRYGNAEPQIDLWGEWGNHTQEHTSTPSRQLQYSLSLRFPLSDNGCDVTGEQIEFNGEERDHTPAAGHLTSVFCWKRDAKPRSRDFGADLKAVSDVLKPMQKYAFNARTMALPAVFDSNRKFRLDPDGFGLATLLDDLVTFDPKVFLDIREEFCRFFPQFRSVRISTEYGIARTQADGLPQSSLGTGKGIYFETQSGQPIRAQHASDGAVLFLGLLALSHLPEPPGLLLLEEPENGVYPTRLGQIIELLKDMANRSEGVRFPQIILTTHSPYVLSFFAPEEVTLLSRPAGEPDAPVRARPLREILNVKERLAEDALYLGELWYNFTEKELFGDP